MARDKQTDLAERTADVALAATPVPLRIVDVGCGAGELLRELIARAPYCESYVGVDASVGNVTFAQQVTDSRIRYLCADPAALPFGDEVFDLVLSSDSFDEWPDQRRGVAELSRVLSPGGTLVIVEHPHRRGQRPETGVGELLGAAGLQQVRREAVQRSLGRSSVQAYIASR